MSPQNPADLEKNVENCRFFPPAFRPLTSNGAGSAQKRGAGVLRQTLPAWQAGTPERRTAAGSEADPCLLYTSPQAEFVDARGGVIMPGLINAHTHIYSALARGLSIDGYNPTSFYEVLDGQWWYIDRNLDLEATRASAQALVIDSIKPVSYTHLVGGRRDHRREHHPAFPRGAGEAVGAG